MSTVPAACAGAIAVSCVPAALTEAGVTITMPKRTVVARSVPKFVRVTVTSVPPVFGPDVGLIFVTVGGAPRYWNVLAPGAEGVLAPPGPVSTTAADPGPLAAGEVTVHALLDAQLTAVAGLPANVTVGVWPCTNRPLPAIVTRVAP